MDYEKEIKELKKQLNNLQDAFLTSVRNQVPVTDRADTAFNKCPQVDENTSGVEENQVGILDVATLSDENSTAIEEVGELSDENSTAIEDLANLVGDLEERVAALEAKEE